MQGHQDFLVLPQARLNLASYSHLSAKLTEPQSALAGREYTEFVWSINKPKPAKKFIIPGVRFDPPKLGTFFFVCLFFTKRVSEGDWICINQLPSSSSSLFVFPCCLWCHGSPEISLHGALWQNCWRVHVTDLEHPAHRYRPCGFKVTCDLLGPYVRPSDWSQIVIKTLLFDLFVFYVMFKHNVLKIARNKITFEKFLIDWQTQLHN